MARGKIMMGNNKMTSEHPSKKVCVWSEEPLELGICYRNRYTSEYVKPEYKAEYLKDRDIPEYYLIEVEMISDGKD